ncbi:Bcr/CflA family drug resistance efflux transporter [Eikenella sp. NML96-A-049]|uniref:multidrug effflux MFS transporter n=1 Tax=unclassified Eikenella TaxID=2639367 RepID=UPI0007E117EC|nr:MULTISPECIES: multidrug effflux MFS transporter [unclassified Eikenella]OAM34391.1 Bcr/CflA family drug resistance efflux transporter [Eikenella sp. NML070372]OAM39137.1 Bcr/CflA family drug resistance efflux transporter [Eikenella sp. NML96-A-049]
MTTHKRSLYFLLVLSALMAFTSLSTDIYLPAMPTMEKQLGGNAELTITGFLTGFAIAQLIWGPISDRIGRKLPLFIGMVLFVIGSVGCALSESMSTVVFWRIFQAVGACVGPMLSRAMIRDSFAQSQAAQMLSTLTIIMAIAPIAGPFIGGGLLKVASWHWIFWLLAMIGVLMFTAIFKLPETLPTEKRASGSVWNAFKNYRTLFTNGTFMRYTLSVTFFYVAAYAFITGSPFVYIDYFGVAEQNYGFLFGINIIGIVGLSFLNRKLVSRFALSKLLVVASLIAFTASAVLFALVWANIGGIWGVVAPLFVMFSMNAIIAACANAAALAAVPNQIAGSAAALLGSLQYGSGIVSSLLLAAFSSGTPFTMAWIIVLFVGLSAVMAVWQWAKKPESGE